MRTELTGAQRDARDAIFIAELLGCGTGLGGFSPEALSGQVERGRRMREVWVRHFPNMRESFNALPELEDV